jgi:hypothetical protein
MFHDLRERKPLLATAGIFGARKFLNGIKQLYAGHRAVLAPHHQAGQQASYAPFLHHP